MRKLGLIVAAAVAAAAQIEILATDYDGNETVDGEGEGGTLERLELEGKGPVSNAPR